MNIRMCLNRILKLMEGKQMVNEKNLLLGILGILLGIIVIVVPINQYFYC